MKPSKDTEQFLVDLGHGHHYHVKGCIATVTPQGEYRELSYGEIRAIRAHDGTPFEPDICVLKLRHGLRGR